MPKPLVLCLMLLFTVSARAADEITVHQLEQRLAAGASSSDKKLEKQIAGLQLTERLDHRLLVKLSKALPGERSRNALLAIADASAFLKPPPSEMTSDPPPDRKEQGQILIRAASFAGEESTRMPNFLAQRVTTRFQDAVHYPFSKAIQYYTPNDYHLFDRRVANLRYVSGQEEEIAPNRNSPRLRDITLFPKGLTTWGEFGPLLETLVADILQSKLGWERWERSDAGKLAVFEFLVPQEKSHYTVDYCCINHSKDEPIEFKATPAYHGEITIDPTTGRVSRVTLACNLAPGQVITRADVELEYGPIEIAGQTYFLPVRGVSASATPVIDSRLVADFEGTGGHQQMDRYVVTSINDLQFQNYRVFRTEMRILPATETPDKPSK